MLRRNAVWLVAIVLIVTGAWIQQAMSQSAPGDQQGRRGPRDPQQMQQRMEQMRQQMAERMKEQLGVTDEEWKVMQPLIDKVMTLSREARGGGMGGMMGGRRGGRPGGDSNAAPPSDRPQSDIQKASEALQKLLDDKDSTPEQIKAALATYREVRAKARAALEAAQKQLREICNMRQEARFVSMGLLD